MMRCPVPATIADCDQATCERWLRRKTVAHAKRDSARLRKFISKEEYRLAIHRAVEERGGLDYFTGEKLAWRLISEYANGDSKLLGGRCKMAFALLPTVDHDFSEDSAFVFRICSWPTNDSKHNLTVKEFAHLCRPVLARPAAQIPLITTPVADNSSGVAQGS